MHSCLVAVEVAVHAKQFRKEGASPLLRAEGETGSPEADAFLSEPLRGPVISLLTGHFNLCRMRQNWTKTKLSEWTSWRHPCLRWGPLDANLKSGTQVEGVYLEVTQGGEWGGGRRE